VESEEPGGLGFMPDADVLVARFTSTAGLYTGLVYVAVTALAVAVMRGRDDFPLVIGLLVVAWLLFPYTYLLYPWRGCKALAKEPHCVGEIEETVSDECLHARNANVASRYEWSMFTKCIERRDLFVLRIGKKHWMVIPKDAFQSENDVARFREIVTSKIGG
jgi:hypothetical protein